MVHDAQTAVMFIVGVIVFTIAGLGCSIWPKRIRDFGLRHQSTLMIPKSSATWMSTKSYLVTLRIIGALSIGSVIVLVIAFFNR